jgi:hypothetical protein
MSDLRELPLSALAGKPRVLLLEMFGESEAQRMRFRLGSRLEELVAPRQPRYRRDAAGRPARRGSITVRPCQD